MNSINVLLSSLFIDTKHSITDYMKRWDDPGRNVFKQNVGCNVLFLFFLFLDDGQFFVIFGNVGCFATYSSGSLDVWVVAAIRLLFG
ncbi:unnamed protein product [Rhizophagus irregularis]|nr:unnamed protein product [Rhizophagus irregularis]CAB5366372.1 unnamed protein product [Rhizophagus irregularis]